MNGTIGKKEWARFSVVSMVMAALSTVIILYLYNGQIPIWLTIIYILVLLFILLLVPIFPAIAFLFQYRLLVKNYKASKNDFCYSYVWSSAIIIFILILYLVFINAR